MTYSTAEARQELLDALAQATERIGSALASLGEAYELLDEASADRLEETLFRPTQSAYARAQRTHAEFAARHGLPAHQFAQPRAASAHGGPRALMQAAIEAVEAADAILSSLQDSMMPIEVGDAPLRAGLEDARQLIGQLRGSARELVRVLGR
ncbi:MAG: hypothetical protein NVS1B9_05180 [Solirubrobacteraceae bacterium]